MTDSEISSYFHYRNFKILSVQLEIIILTKVSQKEKDKYFKDITMWIYKYDAKEPTFETETESRT